MRTVRSMSSAVSCSAAWVSTTGPSSAFRAALERPGGEGESDLLRELLRTS